MVTVEGLAFFEQYFNPDSGREETEAVRNAFGGNSGEYHGLSYYDPAFRETVIDTFGNVHSDRSQRLRESPEFKKVQNPELLGAMDRFDLDVNVRIAGYIQNHISPSEWEAGRRDNLTNRYETAMIHYMEFKNLFESRLVNN